MKKILFILFVFLLAWCWGQKTIQEQKNISAQTWVLATNTETTTWSVETWINIALTNTGENTTWMKNSDSEINDKISFDKEALRILFNLSGNISNTQIVAEKVFFFDSNDGLVKYYEKGKTTNLSWLKFDFPIKKWGSKIEEWESEMDFRNMPQRFYNYKISTDGSKIAWIEMLYFGAKKEIKNVCWEYSNIEYSVPKFYIADIDGKNKILINETSKNKDWFFIKFEKIALFTGNKLYINKEEISCDDWIYPPCYTANLSIFDINTKKMSYLPKIINVS